MDKTFTVAGTSNLNGVVKFRFANDLKGRIKVLERNGHTDVQLFELPEPMTKEKAILWLETRDEQAQEQFEEFEDIDDAEHSEMIEEAFEEELQEEA